MRHCLVSVALALAAFSTSPALAAVKLTAMHIVSTDEAGKIQGVGAHRFRTTQHGGHPAIFLVPGDDPAAAILNGPKTADNEIDITLSAGTHTFTILAERSNSYTWTNYTLQLFFDRARSAQISALVPLNVNSTQFFPPFSANPGQIEDLAGYPGKSPGALVYKSGPNEVTLTAFHFSDPSLYRLDRVSPFEVRSDRVLDFVGQITLEVKAPPQIHMGGVANAAGFAPRVAPGSLFTIFGTDFATTTAGVTSLPLPLELAGTSVTIGGHAAPVVYVSASQINAQVPYEAAVGANVPVVVTTNGVASPPVTVNVVPAAPGLFTFGDRRAMVQNADYSLNTADNPAEVGSYTVAYLTGAGALDHPVSTGNAAGSDPVSRPRIPVAATLNGVPVEIAFAGLTPNLVGLMQVNFKVPALPPGTYSLLVTAGGERSNPGFVTVR